MPNAKRCKTINTLPEIITHRGSGLGELAGVGDMIGSSQAARESWKIDAAEPLRPRPGFYPPLSFLSKTYPVFPARSIFFANLRLFPGLAKPPFPEKRRNGIVR
jgi:hypothetical protein